MDFKKIYENTRVNERDEYLANLMEDSDFCFLNVYDSIIYLDEIEGIEGILVKAQEGFDVVEVYRDEDGQGDGDGVFMHYDGPLTSEIIDKAIYAYIEENI